MVVRLLLGLLALAASAQAELKLSPVPSVVPTPLSALDALSAAPTTPEPSQKKETSPTPGIPPSVASKSSGSSLSASASGQSLSGTAVLALSTTAEANLTPIPKLVPISELSPHFEKNEPVEDFFVVSISSLPFTAFWSFLGFAIVSGVYDACVNPQVNSPVFQAPERVFAPNIELDNLLTTGEIAFGASIGTGLLSVSWGKGVAPKNSSSKVAPWINGATPTPYVP